MRRRILLLLTTTAFTLAGSPIEAQTGAHPETGTIIRLVSIGPDSAWVTGRYDGVRDGRIALRNVHESKWIAADDVARLEVQTRPHFAASILAGAGTGALIGFTVLYDRDPIRYTRGGLDRIPVGAALGALAGLAIGQIPIWREAVPPGRDLFADVAQKHEVVRVQAAAWPLLEGPIQEHSADVIGIVDRRLGRVDVPRRTIRDVQYRASSNRATQGAFVGAAAGLTAMLLARDDNYEAGLRYGWYEAVAVGAGGGAAVGAAAGFVLPRRVWRSAPLNR